MDRFVDARADIRDADDGRFAWSWLVEVSVGHHSEKPSVFCEIIEIYFPTLSQGRPARARRHSASRLERFWPGGAEAARGPHAVDHRRLDLDEALARSRCMGHACRAVGQRRGDGVKAAHFVARRSRR